MSLREYCTSCGKPLEEWETAGRCKGCDQVTNKPFITCQCGHTFVFAGSVTKKYTCPNCGKKQSPQFGDRIRQQVIMLSINGRKAIPLAPRDAANIIGELAEALADGRDCKIDA